MRKKIYLSDLEKSFHEQFAINQNHHQDILFKLLSIIGAVIVGYGYILHGYNEYSISEAIFGLIVSELLLITGLFVVVINASGFRRDQNVCYRIRKKAKLIARNKEDGLKNTYIFPYSFYPFENRPSFFTWMPDFHKLFYFVFICFQILSGIALICVSIERNEFMDNSCFIISVLIISLVISILAQYYYTIKMRKIFDDEKR